MKRILFGIILPVFLAASTAAWAGDDTANRGLSAPGWHGAAVAYAGYRRGQDPDILRVYPSQAEVAQDLKILDRHFKFLRLYGADQHAADVLQVIQREKLGIKVVLAAWLAGNPEKLKQNEAQIAGAVLLANEYPDVVAGIIAGTDILVETSTHKMSEDLAVSYIERIRSQVTWKCPITVADSGLYWQHPSTKLDKAVDFITVNAIPAWHDGNADAALAATKTAYDAIRQAHPGKTVVIGETGWPSLTDGAKDVPGAGSEAKQKRFTDDLTAWAKARGVTVFYLEAFDEPWKGNGTEGHFGLFTETRKAKPAMQALYPELKP